MNGLGAGGFGARLQLTVSSQRALGLALGGR